MDCKAVSPLIGFILLMAIVMGLIGILQSTAIPQWNKAVEAKHLSSLKYEVADISRLISISASTGSPAKVVLKAGVDYPNYYILFSPSKASTTISAVNLSVKISGYVANKPFVIENQSSAIIVEPNYLYSSKSKLIYEHSAVLREEINGLILAESDQSAFSRDSIHLSIIKANFSSFATTETASIILIPESVGGRNIFSGSIEFECYDERTAEWWNETLGRIYGQDKVSVSGRTVKIENLQDISLSISVFSAYAVYGGEISEVFESQVDRLVPLTQTNFNVSQYATVMLGAKAVDQFGNPVRNANVYVYWNCNDNDSRSGSDSLISNERGEIWYYFTTDVNATSLVTCTVDFTANSASMLFEVKVRPFVGECPECPPTTPCPECPPLGSLERVRGATLVDFSCQPSCDPPFSEWNKSVVAWNDGYSLWANSSDFCTNQTFNFTLPYSLNSSVSPVLVWNGTCKDKADKADKASVLVFVNNVYRCGLDTKNNRINGSADCSLIGSELIVRLNQSDFTGNNVRVEIGCSSNSGRYHCPPGHSPWNLSTNYIEILFVRQ